MSGTNSGCTPVYPHPSFRCDAERALIGDGKPARVGRLRYYVDGEEVSPRVYTETAHRYGLIPLGVVFVNEWIGI